MQKPNLITLKSAHLKIGDLVNKAIFGEETIITKMGKPVAKIVGLTEKEIAQLKNQETENE